MAKYEHKRQPVCVCERDKCLMCSEEKYTKICKTNKPEFLKGLLSAVSIQQGHNSARFPELASLEKD